jgi:hypothetical protein
MIAQIVEERLTITADENARQDINNQKSTFIKHQSDRL